MPVRPCSSTTTRARGAPIGRTTCRRGCPRSASIHPSSGSSTETATHRATSERRGTGWPRRSGTAAHFDRQSSATPGVLGRPGRKPDAARIHARKTPSPAAADGHSPNSRKPRCLAAAASRRPRLLVLLCYFLALVQPEGLYFLDESGTLGRGVASQRTRLARSIEYVAGAVRDVLQTRSAAWRVPAVLARPPE